MGNDAPLAVLSDHNQLLYNYFKQLFAQVTNPPIDPIREELVTASVTFIGSEGDLTAPTKSCRMIKYESPLVSNGQIEQLRNIQLDGFQSATLPILFKPVASDDNANTQSLKNALTNSLPMLTLLSLGGEPSDTFRS